MKRQLLRFALLLALTTGLFGCQNGQPSIKATPPPATSTMTRQVEASPTPSPSATPTTPRPTLYLWLHADTDPALVEQARNLLGTDFHVEQGTEPPRAIPNLGEVWALPPWTPETLAPLAREVPTVPIMVMGRWAEDLPENMRVMDTTFAEHPYRAFLAGYVGMLLAPNWRSVLLAPQGDAYTQVAAAFRQGGRYYCGLCRPPKPPSPGYPVVLQAPNPEDPASWENLCRYAQRELFVEVAYLVGNPPPSVIGCVKQAKAAVLWDGAPPTGAEVDLVLRPLTWLEAVEKTRNTFRTQTTRRVVLPIRIQDPGRVLSPGRMTAALELWENLAQGRVAPLTP